MRVSSVLPAGDDVVFSKHALDGSIGKTVRLRFGDHLHEATIESAVVADDGRSAVVTFDCPDLDLDDVTSPPAGLESVSAVEDDE